MYVLLNIIINTLYYIFNKRIIKLSVDMLKILKERDCYFVFKKPSSKSYFENLVNCLGKVAHIPIQVFHRFELINSAYFVIFVFLTVHSILNNV